MATDKPFGCRFANTEKCADSCFKCDLFHRDYISRDKAANVLCMACGNAACDPFKCSFYKAMQDVPAADVVKEENILKFYYVRSIDEYWIGRRLDTLYYAEYESENQQWVWAHSRYLPWGEHVVSPTSLWKEHTYPSEPEEIPFTDWLQGFAKKHIAADVRHVAEISDAVDEVLDFLNATPNCMPYHIYSALYDLVSGICPNCGADMREQGAEGGA